MWGRGGTDEQMDRRKISLFYRTLSPIGAAAQKEEEEEEGEEAEGEGEEVEGEAEEGEAEAEGVHEAIAL